MGKRTIPLRQCRDLCPASGNKTHPYVFQFTTPMGEFTHLLRWDHSYISPSTPMRVYTATSAMKKHVYSTLAERQEIFMGIYLSAGHHVFAAETHTDMEEWMSTIQEVIMEDRQRNRRKKTQSMIIQKEPESAAPQPSLSASGTTPVPLTMTQTPAEANPYEPSNSGSQKGFCVYIRNTSLPTPPSLIQHLCIVHCVHLGSRGSQ